MKRKPHSFRKKLQGKNPFSAELERSNELDGAVAEIIDAFEEARLVRVSDQRAKVRRSMDHIKQSLTLSLRRLAPFAFHAERWLGEEVEKWPADKI